MNEIKKAFIYIFIGIVISAAGFFIYQTGHIRQDSTNQIELDGLRKSTATLSDRNKQLIDENIRITENLGKLQDQIDADNRANKLRLSEIEAGLIRIAERFTENTNTIESIRNGLEQIKILVESLPDD